VIPLKRLYQLLKHIQLITTYYSVGITLRLRHFRFVSSLKASKGPGRNYKREIAMESNKVIETIGLMKYFMILKFQVLGIDLSIDHGDFVP
jgi:hypothetical protein